MWNHSIEYAAEPTEGRQFAFFRGVAHRENVKGKTVQRFSSTWFHSEDDIWPEKSYAVSQMFISKGEKKFFNLINY